MASFNCPSRSLNVPTMPDTMLNAAKGPAILDTTDPRTFESGPAILPMPPPIFAAVPVTPLPAKVCITAEPLPPLAVACVVPRNALPKFPSDPVALLNRAPMFLFIVFPNPPDPLPKILVKFLVLSDILKASRAKTTLPNIVTIFNALLVSLAKAPELSSIGGKKLCIVAGIKLRASPALLVACLALLFD